MNDWNVLEMIPPEQYGLVVASFVGLVLTAIAYMRWMFRYHAKVQDEKLNAIRQEREIEKAEAEAVRRRKDAEIQRQLDETQNGRETMRLLFSELAETRKDDKEVRASYERREAAFIEAMSKISIATQGIESNSASTLALLKEQKDAVETVPIQHAKIIKQNDTTHERISEMMNVLSLLSKKLDDIVVSVSDKAALEEIRRGLDKIQASVKLLENTTQPIPVLPVEISTEQEAVTENKEDETK